VTLPDDQRQQAQTAREAAEALFKPKARNMPVGAPIAETVSPRSQPEQHAPRKPRILSATTAAAAPVDEAEPSPSTSSRPRRAAPRRKARRIPTSAYGRVRALVTYGMTIDDVADLYDVSASEIERIVPARDAPEASMGNRD